MVLRGPDTLRKDIKVPYQFINLECPSIKHIFLKVGKARRFIKDNKIDIVHSHLYESNILARLATPRSVQLINSIHAVSSLASYKINRLSLYLEKITYRKRHVIIAVSKTVLDDFKEWVGLKGKSYVLYNFVEDKFFIHALRPPGIGDNLKMVAVGNLRHQKNYPYLLDAFKDLPSNVTLDIYGQGDMREQLQKQIDDNNLNIRLMGMTNDIEKVLPRYDVFVMSSFFEGQPLALLEATAAGLPSLLSDIPVLREVLDNDALYFNIDETSGFRKTVRDIANRNVDLDSLANRAFLRVKSFAKRTFYLERLKTIYQEQLQ